MNYFADDEIPLTCKSFIDSLVFKEKLVIPYFWYIQVVFLLFIIMFVIYYFVKTKIMRGCVLAALFVSFCLICIYRKNLLEMQLFSLGRFCQFGLFFVLGCLYSMCHIRIERLVKCHYLKICLFGAIGWLLAFSLLENFMNFILCGLFGIICVTMLAYFLDKRQCGIFDSLVGANYMIFLLSWYVNVVTQQALSHVICMPWYCYSILSLGLGLYLPWLLYRYICTHQQYRCARFLTFVLGQRV
jgi:hypothetical protein